MNHADDSKPDRREFLKQSGASAALTSTIGVLANAGDRRTVAQSTSVERITFDGPDSLVHGGDWESLNPGYWQIKSGALRRRLRNYGDRARATGFPFHYETHGRNGGVMPVDYDPSLPAGVIYNRNWKLSGAYTIRASFTWRGNKAKPREGDSADWKMYQPGDGQLGIALGAKSLFESYGRIRNPTIVSWTDDATFRITPKSRGKNKPKLRPVTVPTRPLADAEQISLTIAVTPTGSGQSRVEATLVMAGGEEQSLTIELPERDAQGYFGVVGRGLADFEVNAIEVMPGSNEALNVRTADCLSCYALGDTLASSNGQWRVRFVGLFASDGDKAEIRVSTQEQPDGGWEAVPVCGSGSIVNHKWRRNTATVEVTLPADPSSSDLFYTVWKDGVNVTADPRIDSDGTGPGTGFVGDVPNTGNYVGRLPQLKAPYKICGLSCHAITSGLQQRTAKGLKILGGGDDWQFRDQPTVEAYRHFEDYNFQILCWEDDVWYMELVLYPPSTDDAYRMIAMTIAGPTSRWQMMRHWNVINPGDHDYGMDDVKGPEQIALRIKDGLGQDRDYMRRNFQIVHHLITGDEQVDPTANPKKWRAWKMPNRDFTFVILDSRLWRSSQDTRIWDDEGWGHVLELYDRTDPTRSLLGEEQFAWLQQLVKTDSSPLICLTGLNGMHTVWTGGGSYSRTGEPFAQRDRVAADYAGWVAAGSDRVIELLGSREGIVTVYGDVHNGCIMKNTDHGLIECSFGPIGRSGGRAVIPGFGPVMKDYDGRPLEVTALYHAKHADPELTPHEPGEPFYWNFLEMEFDPRTVDPTIGLRVRNMIDAPTQAARGGAPLETTSSQTGRPPASRLPRLQVLANADVRISSTGGLPIRGYRSNNDGVIPPIGLADVPPGSRVIVTAFDGERSESQVVITVEPKNA